MEAVRRIAGGEKVPALSRELGIHRKLLYEWMRRVNEGGESNLRERGRPRKSKAIEEGTGGDTELIAELKHEMANQQMIIEFFGHALQRIEELRHGRNASGATASSRPSRP
jgi:transposase-like protein